MSEMTFPLPDVGEGLTEAEIVSWRVSPGDTVELNQVICEIETAKSIVELPSPFEGVVTEVLASAGDTVPVGQAILRVNTGAQGGDSAEREAPSVEAEEARDLVADATASVAHEEEAGGAVLVGYGTAGTVRSRRRRGGEPLLQRAVIPVAEASPIIAKPP